MPTSVAQREVEVIYRESDILKSSSSKGRIHRRKHSPDSPDVEVCIALMAVFS
jgi:hypothetical protein